ncbi:creatinase domain-containing protein [Cardiosporidium cionae]|uniref:Creatinase domain-containing protein n=1 Tax=Cardiosporidium cionae TaxID=476202 RepID=A0ABQ7J7Q3_9APIC|nr:creatinase domain-containing protein [Cardiosporidium cionae]|eukprot:KAF8820006.1 creatinase domain-containing protein [Cardiosporidium cionae]
MQLATFYFRGSGISWPKLFLLTHCLSTIVNFPFVFVRGFSVSYRSAILIAPAYQKAQFLNVLPRYFSPPSSRAPHLSLVMALASSGRNTSNVVTPIAPAKNGVANGVLTPAQKLAGLRRLMQENTIDGYIVYSADAHNSEYCRTHDERRAFISEFTGSAGIAVITMNEALLWTDGRYFQQADKELDPDLWKLMKGGLETTPTISRYIRECKQVHRLGLDMYTTSVADFQKLEKELKDEVILVPLEQNLVDSIWGKNQPSVPESTVFTVPLKYTGMEVHSKLQNIREELLRKRVQAVLLSALDEIAWTLNLRGSDVLYNPVFASYLIITAHSAKLYINEKRLDAKSKKQLEEAHVILRPYDAIMKDVSGFYSVDIQSFKFWLDPYINIAVYKSIPDADKNTILEQTPVSLPKVFLLSCRK